MEVNSNISSHNRTTSLTWADTTITPAKVMTSLNEPNTNTVTVTDFTHQLKLTEGALDMETITGGTLDVGKTTEVEGENK